MSDTLSIRLSDDDRATLEAAARQKGSGLSAFVRALAEAEAHRLRRLDIRQQGDKVVEYLNSHAEARAELALYGTPIDMDRH